MSSIEKYAAAKTKPEVKVKSKSTANDKNDSRFGVFRVLVDGEPSIVMQSNCCCMLDSTGVISKETFATIRNEMGEQATRAILNGRTVHFHMNMHDLMKKFNVKRSAEDFSDISNEDAGNKKKKKSSSDTINEASSGL